VPHGVATLRKRPCPSSFRSTTLHSPVVLSLLQRVTLVCRLDYNFQANFWGASSSNHPELIMPYVDTIMRLLPLGRARARSPDWHTAQGFFGPAGQHNQGMQCGASKTGWAGPLGQCPASAGLGNYAGINFPGMNQFRSIPFISK
jgi:hypothetical protein